MTNQIGCNTLSKLAERTVRMLSSSYKTGTSADISQLDRVCYDSARERRLLLLSPVTFGPLGGHAELL